MQCVAGCVETTLTISALKTGHVMGNEDSVADLEGFDFVADFVDDACRLMPQHFWSLGDTVPFDDVAAAYAACHNFQKSLVVADLGNGRFFYADVMVVIINCC